jgi:tight adherence protein B
MGLAFAVFLAVLGLIFGPYWLFILRPEEGEDRALRRRLREQKPKSRLSKTFVRTQERLSSLAPLDAVLARSQGVTGRLSKLIEQSGLRMTVGTLVLASIFAGVLVMSIANLAQPSFLLSLGLGVVASTFPILYVRRAAQKRLAVFEEQFPEAVDLMARALRAGHALTTSLQMVADEVPDPVGGEFRLVFDRQNYGMSLPEALKGFAARVPIIDARFFVTALLTQRETGGNLAEVLDNLASVIRERFKVKRQVRVISAHGRITGWVLGFLPPVIAGVVFMISPAHMRLLVDDPLGLQMTMAGIALQVVGVLVIRRIVDVEY